MTRPHPGPRHEPVLIRIPPEIAEAVRALSRRTRVPIAEYQREAMADLVRKYEALLARDEGDTRGSA